MFLVNGTLLILCSPDEETSRRTSCSDYFGMHRFEWPDDVPEIDFHIGYGDWIRLLRGTASRSRT